MITDKFWENLGSGLPSLWSARLLTPAFAFWGGLVLAWTLHGNRWDVLRKEMEEIYETPAIGVTWLIGLLFLLLITEGLIGWVTLPMLQFAEGYWDYLLKGLRTSMTKNVNQEYKKKHAEFNKLNDKYRAWKTDPLHNPAPRVAEFERLGRLDTYLNSHPLDEFLRLPTRLGNLLRAAEEFPYRAYRLEITHTWSSLWSLLPEALRQELNTARQALNGRTQIMTYGIIYALVSLVLLLYRQADWWAPVAGLLIALASYYVGMLPAAETYASLIRAAYSVHRFGLYKALSWPLPIDDAREREAGAQITLYLTSGIAPRGFYFKHDQKG